MRRYHWSFVLLVVFAAGVLQAATILVGAPSPAAQIVFYPVTSTNLAYRATAAQFSLSSNEFVSSIDVWILPGFQNEVYNFALQNALSGAITTFASGQYTSPGASLTSVMDTIPVNQTINAGTYYVVATPVGTAYGVGGWFDSNGVYVQNAGTVANGAWLSLDQGVTWNFYGPNTIIIPGNPTLCGPLCVAPQFEVNGRPSVPEPASILLLGVGLAAVFRKRMRRRP